MGQKIASLEIELGMATGTAVAEVNRFGGVVDKVSAQAIRDLDRIDASMKNVGGLDAATASAVRLAEETARTALQMARDADRSERAGERLVGQMERQIAVYGLTKAEVRALRAEEAARAADLNGQAELAGRIRAREADLYAMEFASARKARQAADDAAEAAAIAADKATRAKEQEAQAVREAAHAYQMFEARAREGLVAWKEEEAARARAAAEAAVNAQLLERSRIEAALARTMSSDRPRAIDSGASFSALAARAAEEEARALREAAHAHAMFEAAARRGIDAMRDEEEALRRAAAAAAAQDAALHSLRSSVDPLHAVQGRLNDDLQNAVRLYRAGAIGQDEYERSSASLARRLAEVRREQSAQADGADRSRNPLGASDIANIAAQLSDIGVSLAGGQNPFLVLIQQGSQLQGVMQQTGASLAQMKAAVLGLFVVTTPTAAATAALTAAQTAVATSHTAVATTAARAAITAAELAVAEEAAAAAGVHDAAAQGALAVARLQAAAAGETAAAATRQLAAAQEAATAATAAAGASATRSFAPWLRILGPIGVALGTTYGAFKLFQSAYDDDASQKKFIAGLGLTKSELKQLGDTSLSIGDVVRGVWKTVSDASQVDEYLAGIGKRASAAGDWIMKVVLGIALGIPAAMYAAYQTVVTHWETLPQVFGSFFTQAFNAAIREINKFMAESVAGLNSLAKGANGLLGMDVFGALAAPQLDQMKDRYAGAGAAAATTFQANFDKVMKQGRNLLSTIGDNITDANRDRLTREANKIKADRTPKVDRHAEQLAREAAAMEAQIRNLYRLADAYRVSGGAALIAEAQVKAESAAIKKRADIEAMIDRQVRLSIAERVKTAAASAAGVRDQAAIQAEVNGQVAAGLIPAARADELVQRRIAALPLLHAAEAAQLRGLAKESKEVEKALGDQAAAQAAADAAAIGKSFVADDTTADRRLAELRLERELIGATDEARVKALATLRATNEAADKHYDGAYAADYIAKQVEIAIQVERNAAAQREWNEALTFTADQWDLIARNVQNAAAGMADAFGEVGRAIGDMAAIYTGYQADQAREKSLHDRNALAAKTAAAADHENRRHALATATQQIGLYGDMASAARGFFKEGSDGYKGLTTAIQVFRAIEFALSVRAMAQDAIETASSLAKSAARAIAHGVEAVAKAIASMPFPLNIAAGAATAAALAAIGVSIVGAIGGGGSKVDPANEGRGTVLGDPAAQSESIRRGIDALKEVDLLMLTSSREMANHLRSIDSQIGGFAAQIVRSGDVNASAGVTEGFKRDMIGSVVGAIPLIGGFLGGLFGSKTTVVGSGLYGGAQSVGDILASGYDASTYSDVTKTKKFLGVTTSKKTSTQYGAADDGLENQFTLILRGFASAIGAAAGPLGEATDVVQSRLNGFVVDIGKVDLKGLTGEQIQEKLEAIFGAAADGMAEAAFPGIARFQAAGEGMFETLVRVSSTVEAVTASFEMLGRTGIGVDASVALAGLFDSVSDLTSAQQSYFDAFYDEAEQAAARRAQLERALGSLGVAMPATLASFRALVEAQDLATEAGRSTYATLIQLAPAFADLQGAMGGAKSAADIMAERQDLERKLLELSGDEAAIRALDLAKLDASNRGLQQQVWAAEAAKEAAAKADELRKAWGGVGDSIQEEIRRIRGLDAAQGPVGFAALMGQFNAVSGAARAGDMDAAKQLPGLSRSLLDAAAQAATSRQELDRVQAEAAASLEATYAAIAGFGSSDPAADSASRTAEAMAQAAAATTSGASATAGMVGELRALREEVAGLRRDNNAGHAATAGSASRIANTLTDVTADSGGQAFSVQSAAA